MQFEEDVASSNKHSLAHQRFYWDIAHRVESEATRHRLRRRHGCRQAGDIGRGGPCAREHAVLHGYLGAGLHPVSSISGFRMPAKTTVRPANGKEEEGNETDKSHKKSKRSKSFHVTLQRFDPDIRAGVHEKTRSGISARDCHALARPLKATRKAVLNQEQTGVFSTPLPPN
jgi:hypothetical protein